MADAHDRIPETALDWHRAGRPVALATVVQTWGSAPRPVGAQLVIGPEAEMMGSVSGGCVEGAVVAEALEALEHGSCRVLEYGVDDSDAFSVGLACGGTIRILVEPVGRGKGLPVAMLEALVSARAARTPVVLETDFATWNRRLITPEDADAAATAALRNDRSRLVEDDGPDARRFQAVHNPPLRLAVIGAVHIAQPLADMARIAGYDVTLIDPREAFASRERFPGHTLMHDWPDAALATHGLDTRTAVVTLTHDPKLDDPAIVAALGAEVFYIGALGSTRTHAKRMSRLTEAGWTEQQIARIDAPVGLDIGSSSPAEIAISVLAEMTVRLRRPETRPGTVAAAPEQAPEAAA